MACAVDYRALPIMLGAVYRAGGITSATTIFACRSSRVKYSRPAPAAKSLRLDACAGPNRTSRRGLPPSIGTDHDDEQLALVDAGVMNGNDVGMRQRRDGFRFTVEALAVQFYAKMARCRVAARHEKPLVVLYREE